MLVFQLDHVPNLLLSNFHMRHKWSSACVANLEIIPSTLCPHAFTSVCARLGADFGPYTESVSTSLKINLYWWAAGIFWALLALLLPHLHAMRERSGYNKPRLRKHRPKDRGANYLYSRCVFNKHPCAVCMNFPLSENSLSSLSPLYTAGGARAR